MMPARQPVKINKLLLPFFLFVQLFLWTEIGFSADEVHYSNRFLAEEPQIKIAENGTVHIRIRTTQPCSGGRAYLGIVPDVAELGYPAFRRRGVLSQPDAVTLIFEFDLTKLEREVFDLNRYIKRRGGHLNLRVLVFAERLYTIDRVFAYRRTVDDKYYKSTAIVEGPIIDCVTDTSAIISWEFDKPSFCNVEFSPGDSVIGCEKARRFEVSISGLIPSQTYTYSITWHDEDVTRSSRHYTFETAPPAGVDDPFRFAVLADGRGSYGAGERYVEGVNKRTMEALLNHIYNQDVSFITFPGDLVNGYISDPKDLEYEYRSWKRVVQPIAGRIPIYEGMGNHDITAHFFEGDREDDCIPRLGPEAAEVIFAKHFVNPLNGPIPRNPEDPPYSENVYSLDWGNSHFVMLNTNYFQKGSGKSVAHKRGDREGNLRQEQLDWLDDDLRNARDRGQKHLFVFTHEPAFPNGGHKHDAMWWNGNIPEVIEVRNKFWRILCNYGVLAAFFGDEHNFSLAKIDSTVNKDFSIPVWQIVTGGAGAPYYNHDTDVPWAHTVKSFYPLNHYCLVEVNSSDVLLKVYSAEGTLVESVKLSEE
ncbi:hypothetical protein CEE37_14720 [candidate division LCP-89 bacterium B3_LCP]|uniref:Calcineurin-like phosphoesterase domain-containing protein n=1 Tax=candidate division LCP-89 bacterium B3_LCP TaxID=2012998 RepID=A0A532UPH7_UNCL8|nr:MAG: hypothetical protein CEE37_14720 [candidate division LCP-89 bacterium B3_LCP]